MKIITLTNVKQLPRWLRLPLPGESVEQAHARLEKQTGKPVQVYQVGNLHFFAEEKPDAEAENPSQ